MYKVGDKVRVVKDGHYGSEHGAEIGSIHEVVLVDSCGVETGDWSFWSDEVELVTPLITKKVVETLNPGVYGRVAIDCEGKTINLRLLRSEEGFTAAELKQTAELFSQLAEYMESKE